MDSELIKINKLKSAENWTTWKFQIKVMMIANECFAVADGTITKPEPPSLDADVGTNATYQKDLKQWLKLDGTVQRLIVLHVSEQSLLHIINCENAHQMWSKLHSIYEGKTETSIHLLQQKCSLSNERSSLRYGNTRC